MPPLKNINHEKFCHKIIEKNGILKDAYKAVYPTISDKSLAVNPSQLASKLGIRERVQELLEQTGVLGLTRLTSRLSEFVDDREDKSIALDATKFAFKLHGALDEDKGQSGDIIVNLALINAKEPKC